MKNKKNNKKINIIKRVLRSISGIRGLLCFWFTAGWVTIADGNRSCLHFQRVSGCAMDRRGHGQSGDTQEYSLEREFEDVAAVADSLDQRVSVIGHSLVICAAEAALRTRNIESWSSMNMNHRFR